MTTQEHRQLIVQLRRATNYAERALVREEKLSLGQLADMQSDLVRALALVTAEIVKEGSK